MEPTVGEEPTEFKRKRLRRGIQCVRCDAICPSRAQRGLTEDDIFICEQCKEEERSIWKTFQTDDTSDQQTHITTTHQQKKKSSKVEKKANEKKRKQPKKQNRIGADIRKQNQNKKMERKEIIYTLCSPILSSESHLIEKLVDMSPVSYLWRAPDDSQVDETSCSDTVSSIPSNNSTSSSSSRKQKNPRRIQ